MPALGTHLRHDRGAIADDVRRPGIPLARFKVHDCGTASSVSGRCPASLLREWSGGWWITAWRIEVNKLLFAGLRSHSFRRQIVPHDSGGHGQLHQERRRRRRGADIINKSHFLGAATAWSA